MATSLTNSPKNINAALFRLGLILTYPFRGTRMFVVSTKMDRLVSVSLPVAAGKQHRANV